MLSHAQKTRAQLCSCSAVLKRARAQPFSRKFRTLLEARWVRVVVDFIGLFDKTFITSFYAPFSSISAYLFFSAKVMVILFPDIENVFLKAFTFLNKHLLLIPENFHNVTRSYSENYQFKAPF